MGLAVLTGRCWRRLAATVPGHRPIPDQAVMLVGARDLSEAEETALTGSAITRIASTGLPGLADAVDRIAADAMHLHMDLESTTRPSRRPTTTPHQAD